MIPQLTLSNIPGHPEKPEVDPVVRTVPGRNMAWKISWTTKSYANVTEYRLLYRGEQNPWVKGSVCVLFLNFHHRGSSGRKGRERKF